ncbi:MAG: hypothetical protein ACOC1X_02080 [Promethearchaeota archaeon]
MMAKDYFKHLTSEMKEFESTHNVTVCYKCEKKVLESIELIHINDTDSDKISDFIISDIALCKSCFNEIMQRIEGKD